MKAVLATFNQEKALEGAFSMITNLRMELFEALVLMLVSSVMLMLMLVTPALLPAPAEGGSGGRGGSRLPSAAIIMRNTPRLP